MTARILIATMILSFFVTTVQAQRVRSVRPTTQKAAVVESATSDSTGSFTRAEQAQIDKFLAKHRAEFGTDVTKVDKNGNTLLNKAVLDKADVAVVKYLITQGANIHAKNNYGVTPLHWAADTGHIATAQYLISQGADVNAQDDENKSPLHWAAYKGHVEFVKFLVSQGANIDATGKNGKSLLHTTVQRGHVEVAKYLVSQKANVNAKDKDRNTPLHLAAYFGHVEVAKYLVAQGADINAKDRCGTTPLDDAKRENHTAVVRYLESIGAAGKPSDDRVRATVDEILRHRAANAGSPTSSPVAGPSQSQYQAAVSAVLSNDRAEWQRLKSQNSFASDFAAAAEQSLRSNGSLANLRRFSKVQQRYTGEPLDID